MEIVRERLEREFDLDLLVTAPNVAYRVETQVGEALEVHNPSEMPRELERVEEPYVRASIIVPKEYVGAVMELSNERRGKLRPHGVPLGASACSCSTSSRSARSSSTTTTSSSRGRAATRASTTTSPASERRARPRRRADRGRAGRRAVADRPPRLRRTPRQAARRAAARGDPAPEVRRRRSRRRSGRA